MRLQLGRFSRHCFFIDLPYRVRVVNSWNHIVWPQTFIALTSARIRSHLRHFDSHLPVFFPCQFKEVKRCSQSRRTFKAGFSYFVFLVGDNLHLSSRNCWTKSRLILCACNLHAFIELYTHDFNACQMF